MQNYKKLTSVLSTALIVCVFASGYLGFTYLTLRPEYGLTQAKLAETESKLREAEEHIRTKDAYIELLTQEHALTKENASELEALLTAEKNRNDAFEEQINTVTGAVETITKLSSIDPEILQKYSKVRFLNEHYAPEKLTPITDEYLRDPEKPEYISAQVYPFLKDLLEDAKDDGIELMVASGYRSYDEQRGLKSAYTQQYGSGANAFSADQGYSEHQLGTTVDLSTKALGGNLQGFENTSAYTWLTENAHKYGFILSYPKDNAYYIFEPWHWRFVGEDLADDLHDDKKSFYNLDQRTIDEYLISVFD